SASATAACTGAVASAMHRVDKYTNLPGIRSSPLWQAAELSPGSHGAARRASPGMHGATRRTDARIAASAGAVEVVIRRVGHALFRPGLRRFARCRRLAAGRVCALDRLDRREDAAALGRFRGEQ